LDPLIGLQRAHLELVSIKTLGTEAATGFQQLHSLVTSRGDS
jgi:hypothetical protein